MRYLISVSYDGSNFHGFQCQEGFRTIEEEINKAVSYMNRQTSTKIVGCSRTDKGVHANDLMAHFDLSIDIPCFKVKMGLNSMLPDDIYVNSVEKVDDSFHARYMVKSKEYIYKVNVGEYNPLIRNYCYQLCKDLDVDKMIVASKCLIGEHDFRSFVAVDDLRDNSIRTIYDISIFKEDDYIIFKFRGNGFMKYQIRNMVGALIDVGLLKKDVNYVEELLNRKSRVKASKCVPGCGLYLDKVYY